MTPKQVEVVRRRGRLSHSHRTLSAQLQVALDTHGRVVRAHAFIAVRQQEDQARLLAPLGLTRRHILVDNRLRTVGEVTELCFPRDDSMGIADGIAVFESHTRELGERGVVDQEAATVVAVLRQLL